MSKPYYEQYVNHAMRFYARNPAISMSAPGLKKVDVQNWMTCNDAIKAFSEEERQILIDVYRSRYTMPESVNAAAAQNNTEASRIWQLLNRFSKEFAKIRGLI